jgi:hypothetical protein
MENNNILIAEFMGINHLDDDKYINNLKGMKAEGLYFEQGYMTSELKFDTDWNWLMQVVKKCREESNDEDSYWEAIYYSLVDLDIDNVYIAVVEFIKWYNENK